MLCAVMTGPIILCEIQFYLTTGSHCNMHGCKYYRFLMCFFMFVQRRGQKKRLSKEIYDDRLKNSGGIQIIGSREGAHCKGWEKVVYIIGVTRKGHTS